MNVLKEFTNIVYVGRGGGVRNPEPATIYIDKKAKTAQWLCPCGCGNAMTVWYRNCSPESVFLLPVGVAGMNINDEGEVTFHCDFVHPDCPIGLTYGIENNKVKL